MVVAVLVMKPLPRARRSCPTIRVSLDRVKDGQANLVGRLLWCPTVFPMGTLLIWG